MAIDSEGRRRSTLHVLPVPDGTIAAADRAHVLWIYSGIAIGAPVAFVAQIYTANVLANITPTISKKANPSPTREVKIG